MFDCKYVTISDRINNLRLIVLICQDTRDIYVISMKDIRDMFLCFCAWKTYVEFTHLGLFGQAYTQY